MKTSRTIVMVSFILVGSFTGCVCSSALKVPEVPGALRPASDQVVFLEAQATGVQIYECTASQDQPPHFEWVFKAPEAELFDRSGIKIGKHFAGPTWESIDGSKVVGEVMAKDSGPDANSIPWLLLSAKTVSGPGTLGKTERIQRVRTVGGKAPGASCESAQEHHVVRVPYKATYYFYSSKP